MVADHSAATGLESSRERLRALLTMERLRGLGPAGIRARLEETPDPTIACARALAGASRAAADRAISEAERDLLSLDALARERPELRPRLIGLNLAGYPAPLRHLPDPPPVLFSLGNLELPSRRCVAIVGTRRASRYGERITRALAGSLARAGACVVSGLAAGIDGAAHRAALECGGSTVAVLGTGIDVPYPAAHRSLHQDIAIRGLVFSEHPPGERAGPGAFPRRNRIIAALAELTIVVEAGARSGALLTAGHALELGRAVAAVPGPIDAEESAGTNALLRDGAHVISDVADALALLGLTTPPRRAGPELSDEARAVYAAIDARGARLEELPHRAGLPVERCLAALTELELAGAVVCELTGEVSRRI